MGAISYVARISRNELLHAKLNVPAQNCQANQNCVFEIRAYAISENWKCLINKRHMCYKEVENIGVF
jgi:hypothetical protein